MRITSISIRITINRLETKPCIRSLLGHLQLDLILLESTRFKLAAEMAAELRSIAIL
jgi:hypothetical protein